MLWTVPDSWLPHLDTPSLVVDLAVIEANVRRVSEEMRVRGVALRPHFKTHKSLEIVRMQAAYGAVGQTCATLGEAEVLVEAGVHDVFVAYPVWPGGPKRARLRSLHEGATLCVGVESVESVSALGRATRGTGKPLSVLIEIDVGGRRTGVLPEHSGEVAVAAERAGLRVRGVFTHGGHSYGLGDAAQRAAREEVEGLTVAVARLEEHGIEAAVVSAGSTPTALMSAQGVVTEERPGTYVFGDRQQVAIGSCRWEDVALVVIATVVSRTVDDQVVLDCGTKSLGRESQPWLSGFGLLPEWPDAVIERLYDHHAVATVPPGQPRPHVGARVAVVPNHVCPVVNLGEELIVVHGTSVIDNWAVAARAKV